MRITAGALLNIDRLFYPVQRILEYLSNGIGKKRVTSADQVMAIKLMGKGSIIRFFQMCEQLNANKKKLTLITFEHQRDVCEWLRIENVLYIRTRNIFYLITDCWTIYSRTRAIRPTVIVNLERCSHAVSVFGLLLSFRNGSKTILFEPTQRATPGKIIVHSANKLSQEGIFKICIDELPLTIANKATEKFRIAKNKIIININASDLLTARRYSIENFANVIRDLNQYDPSLQFILIGSAAEHAYVEQLVQTLESIPLKNRAGHLSFRQLTEEFASAALVLTGDSMPLHLAVYLDVPVVVLWGPTQPSHFGYAQKKNIHSVTLNLSCSPCFIHPSSKPARHCNGRIDCLAQLKPNQVSEICKAVLDEVPPERIVNFPKELSKIPELNNSIE